MMNYTPEYTRKLVEAIHIHEKELKMEYDGELYLHIQNMRSELRMINDLDKTIFHKSSWGNLGVKSMKNLCMPFYLLIKSFYRVYVDVLNCISF